MTIWIHLKAIQLLLQDQVQFQDLHLNWSSISFLSSVFQFFSLSFFSSFSISFIFVDEGPIGLPSECELLLQSTAITSPQYAFCFSFPVLLTVYRMICMCAVLCFFIINDFELSLIVVVEQSEVGLKKEFREMLPIIVYNETFFVTDTLWVDFLMSGFCILLKVYIWKAYYIIVFC